MLQIQKEFAALELRLHRIGASTLQPKREKM